MKISAPDRRSHPASVPSWDYLHEIHYHRVLPGGERVHEHTEWADDQGWCFATRPATRQEYLAAYTRGCVEDFLDRVGALPGEWLVVVHRNEPRHLVCSIRMHYRPAGTAAAAVPERASPAPARR